MSKKQTGSGAAPPAAPERALVIGRPEDREPEGGTNLKRAGGSASRTFNNVLINATLAALWCPPGIPEQAKGDRRAAAIHALMGFEPQDEIEGMLAAQAVAMHHASMECLRRAMIPEQPAEAAARLRRDGISLARGVAEMLAALDRKRGRGGKQVVRVEHVTVQAGGQAIVGALRAGAPGGGQTDGPRQEPHAPRPGLAHEPVLGAGGAALWGADPERVSVPVSGDDER